MTSTQALDWRHERHLSWRCKLWQRGDHQSVVAQFVFPSTSEGIKRRRKRRRRRRRRRSRRRIGAHLHHSTNKKVQRTRKNDYQWASLIAVVVSVSVFYLPRYSTSDYTISRVWVPANMSEIRPRMLIQRSWKERITRFMWCSRAKEDGQK